MPASVSMRSVLASSQVMLQARGHPHDAGGAVRPALLAGGFVSRRIPCLPDLAAFGVQRHGVEHALLRRDHPVLPVFGDHGHPVAGEIERGGRTRRRRARRRARPPR